MDGVAWRGVACGVRRTASMVMRWAFLRVTVRTTCPAPTPAAAASPSQLLRGHRRQFPMGRRLLPPLTNASGVMLNAGSAGRTLDA